MYCVNNIGHAYQTPPTGIYHDSAVTNPMLFLGDSGPCLTDACRVVLVGLYVIYLLILVSFYIQICRYMDAPKNWSFQYKILPRKGQVDRGEKCSICQACLWDSSDRVAKTSCGHTFHFNCFRNWMKKSNRGDCPLCRKCIREH